MTRYDTDAVLVPRGSRLEADFQAMTADEQNSSLQWRKVYADDGFLLYLKSGMALPMVDRTNMPLTAQIP